VLANSELVPDYGCLAVVLEQPADLVRLEHLKQADGCWPRAKPDEQSVAGTALAALLAWAQAPVLVRKAASGRHEQAVIATALFAVRSLVVLAVVRHFARGVVPDVVALGVVVLDAAVRDKVGWLGWAAQSSHLCGAVYWQRAAAPSNWDVEIVLAAIAAERRMDWLAAACAPGPFPAMHQADIDLDRGIEDSLAD